MYDICRSVSVFNKSKDLSVVILTIPTISTKLCEIRNSQNTQFFTVSILNSKNRNESLVRNEY